MATAMITTGILLIRGGRNQPVPSGQPVRNEPQTATTVPPTASSPPNPTQSTETAPTVHVLPGTTTADTTTSSSSSSELATEDTETPESSVSTSSEPAVGSGTASTGTREREQRQPTCSESNTGNYGFTNSKEASFKVTVYYKEGSEESRSLIVTPGQTQYVYDFPVGRHNYAVIVRALVPIMSFPPGAPTMPRDLIYQQGEIYVKQCESEVLNIK